jgi:hypothetical protein
LAKRTINEDIVEDGQAEALLRGGRTEANNIESAGVKANKDILVEGEVYLLEI